MMADEAQDGWGAPRIHAELTKLGFLVSEMTVSRYMLRRPAEPDQVKRWVAFLRTMGAGTLYAYLEGSGVEIMASSNNVLRGGLTKKHIDIAELLKAVDFVGEEPGVVRAVRTSDSEQRYETPAREFELRRIESPHENDADHGPEILLVVDGEAMIGPYHVRRGEAVCISGGEAYAVDGSATIYKATVPR